MQQAALTTRASDCERAVFEGPIVLFRGPSLNGVRRQGAGLKRFPVAVLNSRNDGMDKEWVVENGGWDGTCDTWQNYYGIDSSSSPIRDKPLSVASFRLAPEPTI